MDNNNNTYVFVNLADVGGWECLATLEYVVVGRRAGVMGHDK